MACIRDDALNVHCTMYNSCVDATYNNIRLTKTTAAQDDDAFSNYTMRGLYFLAVVFVTTIVNSKVKNFNSKMQLKRCNTLMFIISFN